MVAYIAAGWIWLPGGAPRNYSSGDWEAVIWADLGSTGNGEAVI